MTWKEAMDEVLMDLKSLAPVTGLTQYSVFRALTKAQHELQAKTGLCRKQMDLDLSTIDAATGTVPTNGLIALIDRAALITVGGTLPFARVHPVDNETFERMMIAGAAGRVPSFPPNISGVVTLKDSSVMLYPWSGVTGTLRLYYQPKLRPYTPSDTVQWPDYATQFDAKIKANGPEEVFVSGGAMEGIIARAKYSLVRRAPSYVRDDLRQDMQTWGSDWRDALAMVEESNPSMAMNAEPEGYFVAVK